MQLAPMYLTHQDALSDMQHNLPTLVTFTLKGLTQLSIRFELR